MHSYDQMFHKINIYHLFKNVDKMYEEFAIDAA